MDLSVVLISNALDEVEAISAAVDESAHVVIYDAANTDLAGINEILAGIVAANDGQEIGHLAILRHATRGVLQLGDVASITASDVQADPSQWMQTAGLLADDARIDFYGCDLGAGESGAQFVDSVAAATGAVVWASDDATGNVTDADWDFEVRSGASLKSTSIETSALENLEVLLAISDLCVVTYNGDQWTVIWGTAGNDNDGPVGVGGIAGTLQKDILFGLGGQDQVCGDTINAGASGSHILFGDWPDSSEQLTNAIRDLCGLNLACEEAVGESWEQSQARWNGHVSGRDWLYGDSILGAGSGNDRLYGGSGNDILSGGDGLDRLYGDDGDDKLYGGGGADNDWLWGGLGYDWLYGQAGNDTLCGDLRWDIFVGGTGNDTYSVRWP
ncbi:DUF4347 domain-containing protein [Thermodesulfobacteriota bacterium]